MALNGDVVSGPAASNLSEQFHSFSYISEFASFPLFSLHWCDHIKSFQCLSLALSTLPRRLHQRTQRWSDTGCFTFYWNECLQIWFEYTHDKETLLYIYTLLTLAWHITAAPSGPSCLSEAATTYFISCKHVHSNSLVHSQMSRKERNRENTLVLGCLFIKVQQPFAQLINSCISQAWSAN